MSVTTLTEKETTGVIGTRLDFQREPAKVFEITEFTSVTGASGLKGTLKPHEGLPLQPISIDVLYDARDARSAHFNRALELLALASAQLNEARSAAESVDVIGSASAMLNFEGLLQPLFECRAVGDGFANVVNSVHMAIANREGEPLSKEQVSLLWRIFRELGVAPFLSFADSLKFVRQLQKVGLDLHSRFISEWASGSSDIGAEGIR